MSIPPSPVVLGGNGVIGRETVRALIARGATPISVGRRPATIDGAVSVSADLLRPADVARALRGAEVAYLTVGLPYSHRVWQAQWPVILRHTIDAARAGGTHLIYLDNVYAYGHVDGPMTESTPTNPVSKKGRVRADALRMLRDAADRGLGVTIARSADFFGPGATTSVFNTFALDRLAAGRRATWLFDADQPHSLTYTRDAGEALASLGDDPRAHAGAWHLPTAPALTGREYIALAGGDRVSVMSSATMRLGALFASAPRETLEMAYQYTRPYVFDSERFETAFAVSPTPTTEAIATTLAAIPAR